MSSLDVVVDNVGVVPEFICGCIQSPAANRIVIDATVSGGTVPYTYSISSLADPGKVITSGQVEAAGPFQVIITADALTQFFGCQCGPSIITNYGLIVIDSSTPVQTVTKAIQPPGAPLRRR